MTTSIGCIHGLCASTLLLASLACVTSPPEPADSGTIADGGASDTAAGVDHRTDAAGVDHRTDAAGVDHRTDAAGVDHRADAAAADHTTTTEDPSAAGPFTVTSNDVTVENGDRSIDVTVYAPAVTSLRAVLAFAAGYQVSSDRYSVFLQHLASHGFLVLGCDLPQGLDPDHVAMAQDLSAVLDWAYATGGPAAGSSAPRAVLGHSLGGKVSVMAAYRDSRLAAVLAIDPVNSAGQGDYTETRPDIVPDEVQGLTIPLGFAGETVNSSGGIGQACAPADQNFQTFYAAAAASTAAYQWDFVGADHMDFLDDDSWCLPCAACTAGTADRAQVQADLRTIGAAFFLRHLAGQSAQAAYLTGAAVPASVTAAHKP